MKYQVGDIVRVKEQMRGKVGQVFGGYTFVDSMCDYIGLEFKVGSVVRDHYYFDNCHWSWTDEMVEPVRIKESTPIDTNITWLVGISHKNKHEYSPVYWFKADETLLDKLIPGTWVVVDTCYGPATGKVVYFPLKITRNADLQILSNVLHMADIRNVVLVLDYKEIDNLPF